MQIEKPNPENEKNPLQEEEKMNAFQSQEEIPEEKTEAEIGDGEVEVPEKEGIPEEELGEAAAEEESDKEPAALEEPEKLEKKRPSAFMRMLNFLFGRESRVGRFIRPVLRVTALVVGMLAIGLLIAYFTLYIPVRNQRDQALAEIQRINLELEETQGDLESAQKELESIESSTSTTIENLEEQNEFANFKVNFLIVKNDVLRARLALLDQANGPGGPSAMAALNELAVHLDDLNPYVEEADPVLADLLQDRLSVVRGELARDAEQAKVELERFYANLLELEDTLFQ